jgi:hypothetical protein
LSERLAVRWRPRERPLAPVAVAARGEAAPRLARRLLRGPQPLTAFRLVAGRQILVVLGPSEDLPWVDGVFYLGRDDSAPALLLPTHSAPTAPLPLLERAWLRRAPGATLPLAVVPGPGLLISIGRARTARDADVRAWLEGQV